MHMTNTCRFVPFKQAQSNHGLYTEHMYFSKQAYTYVLGYTLYTFSKQAYTGKYIYNREPIEPTENHREPIEPIMKL